MYGGGGGGDDGVCVVCVVCVCVCVVVGGVVLCPRLLTALAVELVAHAGECRDLGRTKRVDHHISAARVDGVDGVDGADEGVGVLRPCHAQPHTERRASRSSAVAVAPRHHVSATPRTMHMLPVGTVGKHSYPCSW